MLFHSTVCSQTCKNLMAAQKHFSQDNSITKEHSLKRYKIHARTLVSRPNSPEKEYRQCVKQQDDRSNVSESVAVSDEWNEPGSVFKIHNITVSSFSFTTCQSVKFRKNLRMTRT